MYNTWNARFRADRSAATMPHPIHAGFRSPGVSRSSRATLRAASILRGRVVYMGVTQVRNIVLAAGAVAALAVVPQFASAAPMLGGGALKAAADSAAPVENVTYYGYGRRYGYGYGGFYRPRYYGYYNYYRPRYYGYGYRPYRYRYYY